MPCLPPCPLSPAFSSVSGGKSYLIRRQRLGNYCGRSFPGSISLQAHVLISFVTGHVPESRSRFLHCSLTLRFSLIAPLGIQPFFHLFRVVSIQSFPQTRSSTISVHFARIACRSPIVGVCLSLSSQDGEGLSVCLIFANYRILPLIVFFVSI